MTADVIDVFPDTPNLDAMLNKFNSEHWHDEDEVRFIVEGRGLFHIHPQDGPVFAIEVEAGDLIRVPRGTHHWFDLCADRRIRAIRLFQDPSGWTPHYTSSGVDKNFQPVCFGPSYFPGPSLRFRRVTLPGAIRVVLLDIEGTTTPIAFVHERLFTYARSHLPTFVASHWNDPPVRDAIRRTQRRTAPGTGRGAITDPDSLTPACARADGSGPQVAAASRRSRA